MEHIEIKKQKTSKTPAVLIVLLFTAISLAIGYYFITEPKEKPEPVIEKSPAYCLGEYESEICKYAWEDRMAIAVMRAESEGNPSALGHNRNGTVDFGLFQINEVHLNLFSLEELASPLKNIASAYKMWDLADGREGDESGDWRIWEVFNNGSWYDEYIELGKESNPEPSLNAEP